VWEVGEEFMGMVLCSYIKVVGCIVFRKKKNIKSEDNFDKI
jgi:hypothetical protein